MLTKFLYSFSLNMLQKLRFWLYQESAKCSSPRSYSSQDIRNANPANLCDFHATKNLFIKYFGYLCLALFVASCNTAQRTAEDYDAVYEVLKCKGCYAELHQLFGGPFIADGTLSSYASRIMERLSMVGEESCDPRYLFILNDNRPICFSTKKGEIGISRSLLVKLDNEAELAALIALKMISEPRYLPCDVTNTLSTIEEFCLKPFSVTQEELEKALQCIKLAGYEPSALYTVSVKLSKLNLTSFDPAFASQIVESQSQKGYIGVHAFQNSLSFLKAHKSDYKLFSQAKGLIQTASWEELLSLSERGIHSLPDESHFYALRGLALMKLRDFAGSLESFNKALYLLPNYHHYYSLRGSLFEEMAEKEEALADFKKSLDLLPCAETEHIISKIISSPQ